MNALRLALPVLATFFAMMATHAKDVKPENQNAVKDYSKTEVEAADRALNAQFKKTREELEKIWKREWSKHPDESAVDTLVAAERAWIAYRDAECKLRAKSFDGGTAYSTVIVNCVGELTERRIQDLKYIVEDFTR